MRFSLATLLLSVMVVATATNAFGLVGFVLALIGLAIAAMVHYFRSLERELRPLDNLLLMLPIACLTVLLLWPAQRHAGPAALQGQCDNNLKQIGIALYSYRDDHGCFPPAYIPDATGKPMHSWRVLILPYVECAKLFKQYDFSEPWDGPNNRKLAAQTPSVYQCPSTPRPAGESLMTSYMAVVGPQTAWPGAQSRRIGDIRDSLDNTVLVVEVADPTTNWMEPEDLSFNQLVGGATDRTSSRRMTSGHTHRRYLYHEVTNATVLFADGSVLSVPDELPPETLEALLTVDGGETLAPGALTIEARPNWSERSALWAFLFSVVLLAGRPVLRAVFRRQRDQGPGEK